MRIVIATWGSHGDLHPALGLAVGLRDRGHDAMVATCPMYRDDVEREGLAFQPVRPDVDPNNRELVARIMDAQRGTEFIFKDLLMPALQDAAADSRPAIAQADLVISHPVTFAVPVLAEESRRPWASMVLAPMSFFSVHDVPVLPPAPWLRRIAERSPWVSRALVGLARRATRNWTAPVAGLRKSHGLPPGGDPVFEGQHSPHLVLALFSRVLAEPQPDWPGERRGDRRDSLHRPGGGIAACGPRGLSRRGTSPRGVHARHVGRLGARPVLRGERRGCPRGWVPRGAARRRHPENRPAVRCLTG